MRADILPGVAFPEYELTDHTGKHRKLSERQRPDPMTLVLGRGGYRPKHRRQAERLVQLYHEMELGYCRLITITTDNLTTTNEYRTGVGAHLDIFCRMQDAWCRRTSAVAEYTDPTDNPMIPHTVLA
jgi:hypothetical protein